MHELLAPGIEKRLSLGTTEVECWPFEGPLVQSRGKANPSLYVLIYVPRGLRAEYGNRRYVSAYRTLYEWYFDVKVPNDVMIRQCPKSPKCGNPTHFSTNGYPNGAGYRQRSLRLGSDDSDDKDVWAPPADSPVHCFHGHVLAEQGVYRHHRPGFPDEFRCRLCQRIAVFLSYHRAKGLVLSRDEAEIEVLRRQQTQPQGPRRRKAQRRGRPPVLPQNWREVDPMVKLF